MCANIHKRKTTRTTYASRRGKRNNKPHRNPWHLNSRLALAGLAVAGLAVGAFFLAKSHAPPEPPATHAPTASTFTQGQASLMLDLFRVSGDIMAEPVGKKTEPEWKSCLTPEQYKILREKGTELPFTGNYLHNKETGMYLCAACGNELFAAGAKFDSGTGWPSFWESKSPKAVEEKSDAGLGLKRTEVVCSKCGGHLGHVFDDGPKPTGKRYCINSGALKFKKSNE